ncbi:uncharacterized protein LOC126764670 [Bactrocera neohumeralis]|uniref:uncharacterized protein LOC126764670 n=1 Tax=Bactrocera neohumeralis TaxID=98809 RepID=UPI0021666886|nr:uncharacterized protein LOC126764670 [Bactrocera neohumeralis]
MLENVSFKYELVVLIATKIYNAVHMNYFAQIYREAPKIKQQTQPKQFEILVDFMKAHPDLSKGSLKTPDAKNTSNNLWKNLVSHLNAAGPPLRDIAGWKKVWADYKIHLNAKMRRNKNNISGTGGGPSLFIPLSQLEQQLSELLSIEESINGMSGTLSFGAAISSMSEPP